jgi:hypothetical protein
MIMVMEINVGQLVQDSQNKTIETEQPEKDYLKKTGLFLPLPLYLSLFYPAFYLRSCPSLHLYSYSSPNPFPQPSLQ